MKKMKKDCEEENCVVPAKNGGGLAEKKSEIEKNELLKKQFPYLYLMKDRKEVNTEINKIFKKYSKRDKI